MKRRFTLLFVLFAAVTTFAQQKKANLAELSLSAGDWFTVSASYTPIWGLGKSKKLKMGVGVRLNSSFGNNLLFETAPAKLTSGQTGPGVLFAENIKANIDTLRINSPQVNALNLYYTIEYAVSKKFDVGFNIDLLGFSFGGSKPATYLSNNVGTATTAKPTAFNLLLISDNDLGTLNSEIYGRYHLNKKIALKAGATFIFNEYKTTTKVQNVAGQTNDRFRNKALMAMVGISFKI